MQKQEKLQSNKVLRLRRSKFPKRRSESTGGQAEYWISTKKLRQPKQTLLRTAQQSEQTASVSCRMGKLL